MCTIKCCIVGTFFRARLYCGQLGRLLHISKKSYWHENTFNLISTHSIPGMNEAVSDMESVSIIFNNTTEFVAFIYNMNVLVMLTRHVF